MTIDVDEPAHFHRFALHKHPDWHGHCGTRFERETYNFVSKHSCRRWHFHLPFTHRHTPDGR